MMTRQQVLDLYFMDARCKLIEIAAFLDRLDRAKGEGDFRLEAFRKALGVVAGDSAGKAAGVLMSLSDTTREPIAAATTKAACGAPPPAASVKAGATPAAKRTPKAGTKR